MACPHEGCPGAGLKKHDWAFPVPYLCRGRQGMCSCSNPFPGLEVKGHPLLTKLS